MKQLFRNDVWLLVLLGSLVFVLNLWGYPLFDVDEPRYAETAREMLLSSANWITPHFNWMPRFDKPALFYWLIAFSYKLFGISAFSARLVSALAAILTMLMLYFLVRRVLNQRSAVMTSLIFITMMEVYSLGRWAVTDMTLTFCMTATWLSLYLVLTKNPRWYMLAGFFAGLGALTKGPVALALPAVTFILMIGLYERKQWRCLISPWLLAGLAVFLGVALPWYLAVNQANPTTFFKAFFLLHNVSRFKDTVSGHHGSWYYYIPVILLGAFPWSAFLPGLICKMVSTRRAWPRFLIYSHLWFWTVIFFFSLAGTKLLTYILPAFPALALMLGWYWHQITTPNPARLLEDKAAEITWLSRGMWFFLGVLILGAYVFIVQPYRILPPSIQSLYSPQYPNAFFLGLLFLFIATLWLNFFKKMPQEGFWVLSYGMIILLVFTNLFLLPELGTILQKDTIAFASRALKDHMPLATYKMKKPSLVFYTQHPIYFVPQVTHVSMPNIHEGLLYLMVKNKDLPVLNQSVPTQLIQKGNVYSLVETDSLPYRKDINE